MRHREARAAGMLLVGAVIAGPPLEAQSAWEPSKPIEFVIPTGTGGGADQMSRLIARLADKHKLSPQPLVPINKPGGQGAEGFLYVKAKNGDAHTIVFAYSNIFTTPLSTGAPFRWKDLTPIGRLALDRFILWVHADSPYMSAKEYIAAARKKGPMKMGGTGSAQEDQIITVQLQQATGAKFAYVPFRSGGEVCEKLVDKQVDSTVNNPIECVSHWKAGRVRPLAVFDEERVDDPTWKEIPTVKEALGTDLSYNMLRGVFGPLKMPKDAVEWYQRLLQQVLATPEFQEYLERGALKPSWLAGRNFTNWLGKTEQLHKELMARGGLLKP